MQELPGARDEGGPARVASGGAEAKRRPVRGVRGAEPPASPRPRAKRAARPRIEHLTAIKISSAQREWWQIQFVTRQALRKAKVPEATISSELVKLKESFFRDRKRT